MKKRVLSLLLAMVMIIGLLPVTAKAGTLDDGLVYEIYADHVEITDYTGDAAEVVIPTEIEGLPVTSIGDSAFRSCENLTSISIPDCVTEIGSYAFYGCSSLSNIYIPEGVDFIRNHVFYGCTNLVNISIPKGVYSIGDYAFAYCSNLTNFSDLDRLTKIGNYAFHGCTKLTNIFIPDGIKLIGDFAFNYCEKLSNICIPDSVTSIGDYAFANCEGLTSISIPEGISAIGKGTFKGCSRLVSVFIPDSVTKINDFGFSGCERLTSISIPRDVTLIGQNAFADCKSITTITVPDGVLSIGRYAFSGCKSLVSISLPDSVTSIGYAAFENCENLINITIPCSVTKIADYAFDGCGSLSSICIPVGVTAIGEKAFSYCSDLTSISIPDSVSEIGEKAFYYCSRLDYVYFNGDAPWFDWDVFYNVTATAYYPVGNSTWIVDVMQDYGGNITWIPYDPNHTHEYEANVTTPTCTEQGFTTYTCSCGDSYVSDYVDALGHDMGEWKTDIAPTCTENGSETRSCSRCDYTENRAIDALGHSYTGTVTAPTCTEQGFTTYTCSCGDSYVSDEVPALGHTEETIPAVTATCIETGLTEGKKCSVCGEVLVAQETVSALGHDWKGTSCQRCDATRENPFTDVADGSFYIDPVLWAVENGITSGTSKTTFDPSGLCLRAHVVTFLYRAAGSPVPSSNKNPFTDVKSGDFYYNPVLWAVENGITQGISKTQFGSTQVCNRAAVVTFLWRAFGSPEPKSTNNPFVDVKNTDFFYKPVLWAVENGITAGIDATHFNPAGACNRAQVVTFLYRAYN